MNCTAYIFGNLGSGYTQYPDDSQSSIFQSAVPSGNSGLFIRRDASICWCIYRRNLSSDKYLGLAVGFNGVCCNLVKSMFSIFESAVNGMAMEGNLIGFADNGENVPLVDRLSMSRSDVERISGSLCAAFSALPATAFTQLPPLNYGAGAGEKVEFSETASAHEIKSSLESVSAIDIQTDREDPLFSYTGRLKDLSTQNETLREDLKKMEKQKKRTTLVTVLVILIAVIFSVFMAVSVNLNDEITSLRSNVRNLEQTVDEKETLIEGQKATIQDKNVEISGLNTKLSETEAALSSEKATSSALRSQKAQLESQVSSLKSQVQSKTSEVSRLNTQLSSQKDETSKWIGYYNSKSKTVTQLEKQISELRSQISSMQQQLSGSRKRR